MPTLERIVAIENEIDALYVEQATADIGFRRALARAKQHGDAAGFVQVRREYVDGCNDRGRRRMALEDELFEP